MGKKMDLMKWIAIFLIIVGILPFVGVNVSGISKNLIQLLLVVSGIVIIMQK